MSEHQQTTRKFDTLVTKMWQAYTAALTPKTLAARTDLNQTLLTDLYRVRDVPRMVKTLQRSWIDWQHIELSAALFDDLGLEFERVGDLFTPPPSMLPTVLPKYMDFYTMLPSEITMVPNVFATCCTLQFMQAYLHLHQQGKLQRIYHDGTTVYEPERFLRLAATVNLPRVMQLLGAYECQ